MAGFPKLIPAFTALIEIEAPSQMGPAAKGGAMTHVAFPPGSGSLRSEPGYSIALDATFQHGSDFIRADASGKAVRLEVHSLLKDKTTGGLVRLDYTGTITMGGGADKVLHDAAGAVTTDFGEVFAHMVFETDHPALLEMQNKVYVGAGRFILEQGKGPVVEYKISEVAI